MGEPAPFADLAAIWSEHWTMFEDPARRAVLDRAGVGPGTALLDLGCGTGELCVLATARGADAHGIDAAADMVGRARAAAPTADLRAGSVEALPWDAGRFDVVCAFNVLQYVPDPVTALAEARRVARPGGAIVVACWGPRDEQRIERVVDGLRALAPPGELDPAPDPGAPGAVEALLGSAGLAADDAGEVDVPFVAAGDDALDRAFRLDTGLLGLGGRVPDPAIRAAILAAAAPYRLADGSYRFANRFRWVLARG